MKPFVVETTLQAPVEYIYDYLCDVEREIANNQGKIIDAAYDTAEAGGHLILSYQVDLSLAIVREVLHFQEKIKNQSILSQFQYERYSISEHIQLQAESETSTRVRIEYKPKSDTFYNFTTFGMNRVDAKRMAEQLCNLKAISIRDVEDLYLRTQSSYSPFPIRHQVSKEEVKERLKRKAIIRV
ncbi:hypothetical protein [Thermoactinomyces sp. DSM 45892]|uniref:hypothetical protein n=1 Tax=Thermoactinomyces sp. DSM 45892 TaxID=1882753 RepID=UPI000895F6A6|nr:hypothetical protein [Thermoactinomyces sp. DSM 45892]SDZ09547.1 hypothetical protein SAMN05444416_11367 [Thermoactinomyces sp. DSM 45892]